MLLNTGVAPNVKLVTNKQLNLTRQDFPRQLPIFLTSGQSLVIFLTAVKFPDITSISRQMVTMFGGLALLAGQQEGHPACKKSCANDSQLFIFGDRPDLE